VHVGLSGGARQGLRDPVWDEKQRWRGWDAGLYQTKPVRVAGSAHDDPGIQGMNRQTCGDTVLGDNGVQCAFTPSRQQFV
jgi:hypothetical protein